MRWTWMFVGVLGLTSPSCSKDAKKPEPKAAQSEAAGSKQDAEAEAEAEAKEQPAAAKALMPGVRGEASARDRLQAAADATPKGTSPLASAVPTPPDVAAAPEDAVRSKSGLAHTVLAPGTGPVPKAGQKVKVHYSGWTPQGRLFDSSVTRNSPLSISLDKTSAGWREALSAMKVGERRRLWVPEAQTEQAGATVPPGPLVFELELLEIVDG